MSCKGHPEDAANTETEDETIAAKKKRSRRVSFADVEITSVHIFKRDEDYYDSTPPSDPKPGDSDSGGKSAEDGGLLAFRDLGDHSDDSRDISLTGDDAREEDGEEVVDEAAAAARKSFLRPIESPSPGSSIFGSATSNDDEDNFFGPVSASFIRPGRLSDSAASDENHDLTMDSTAFSMHFRSLARSDSGVDLKTPTGMHLSFDEKTPSEKEMSTHPGSLMALTNAGKLTPLPPRAVSNGQSGGKDSNDMSLIGDNPNRYDYGRLSPSLDALLAEGNLELHPTYISDFCKVNSSPVLEMSHTNAKEKFKEDIKDSAGKEMCDMDADGTNQTIVGACFELDKASSASERMPNQKVMNDLSNGVDHFVPDVSIDQHIHTPNHMLKLGSGFQQPIKGSIKENSPWKGSLSHVSGQDSERLHGSQLMDSISSLESTRRKLFLETTNSPANCSTVTPSAKLSGSVLSKESARQNFNISSVLKHISEFRSLNSSPSASAHLSGIEALKHKLYYLSSSPSNTAVANNSTDLISLHAANPGAIVKDFRSHNSSGLKTPTLDKMNHYLSRTEQNLALTRSRESAGGMPMQILYSDQPTWAVTAMASPSIFSLSGGQVVQPLSVYENSGSIGLVACEADHPSTNVAPGCRKDNEERSMSYRSSASPVKSLHQQSLTSGNDESFTAGLSMEWYQNGRSVHIDTEQSGCPLKSLTSGGYPIEDVEKIKSPFLENMLPSGSKILDLHCERPLKNCWIGVDGASSTNEVSAGRRIVSPVVLDFTYPSRVTDQSLLSKNLSKKLAQSPSKDRNEMLHYENMKSFVRESIVGSKPDTHCIHSGENQRESCLSKSPSPSRKRRGDDLADADSVSKVAKTMRLIEMERSEGFNVDSFLNCFGSASENFVDGFLPCRNWKDVFAKFLEDIREMLPHLAHKLDLRGINVLDEMLLYLQKVRNYELLSSEIQSQKKPNLLCSAFEKRLSEIKLLLYKISHEKIRLQLKRIKCDHLQKMQKILMSSIHESHKLKIMSEKTLLLACEDGIQTDDTLPVSCFSNSEGGHEVTIGMLASMKQEYEMLDKKIKNLTKSFSTYCKMKGESNSETIRVITDFMKKRMVWRSFRLDLQLWKVGSFESRSGHHNITLDYVGLIYQRFQLTARPTPSLSVSYGLKDTKIEKNFPNMDAGAAFSFIFDCETTRKYSATKCLAQETQLTHLVLRSLLDVLEEVLLGRLEIKHLIHTSFCLPREGQLDLLLSFIDFNSYQRIKLSFDMTCLKCGVYPSELLPYRVEAFMDNTSHSLPQSLLADITAAVEHLPVGSSRILRLCRCVSKLLQR